MLCLFCDSNGPFSTVEHIIPESLGNDDLVLKGHVCDGCQRYFGKEVERFVLEKSPIAFWRTLLGITTKKGKLPRADLSQPQSQRGILPSRSEHHDDLALEACPDGSARITTISAELAHQFATGARNEMRLVLTPHVLYMLGRFLCKVGLELACFADPEDVRSPRFDLARRYARIGPWNPIWPVLWYQAGRLDRLSVLRSAGGEQFFESECFNYWLGDVSGHRLFEFGIGTDRFALALDDAFCPLLLKARVSDPSCRILCFSPESLNPREPRGTTGKGGST